MQEIKMKNICPAIFFLSWLMVSLSAGAMQPAGGSGHVRINSIMAKHSCVVDVRITRQNLSFDRHVVESPGTSADDDNTTFTISDCQGIMLYLKIKSNTGTGLSDKYISSLDDDHPDYVNDILYYSVSVGEDRTDNTITGGTTAYGYRHTVPLDNSREVTITPDSNYYSFTARIAGYANLSKVPGNIYHTSYTYTFEYQ
ncbi:TPA: hypothetical protein MM852_004580 [Salmonella enterica subsp. enterica]|nr:hypothetical protein [Salmonella enterica subsp. enterica]